MTHTPFSSILTTFRKYSFSERDKGNKFERLMQAYLQTDPIYANQFVNVWLWNDFPARKDFGGKDTGIDLVAKTTSGDYWAIQCKCFAEEATIDKPAVDSFLATSSKKFENDSFQTTGFAHRLWISTTNKWGPNAEETVQNQHPPVSRLSLYQLEMAGVDWGKLEQGLYGEKSREKKKTIFAHQTTAMNAAHEHFEHADRGKLIMACGTGKTFTSLKIAENETGGKGLVLFLVPSIALLGQTLREWTTEANETINAICICSDSEVSRKKTRHEDSDGFSVVDLALPASTNKRDIIKQFNLIRESKKPGMTVVFSTYQSIEVIAETQAELLKADKTKPDGFGVFDLIICDEAHRTTGVTLASEDSSAFVKVHDNDFLRAKKRLYMTATPRLYNEDSKTRAGIADAILCSMDNPTLYGEEFYRIGFGEAVEKELLTDYKVLILTISENDMSEAVQKMVSGDASEINSDDASKLIGCINALSKKILGDAGVIKNSDPEPMRRAVAFCSRITDSEKITRAFNETRGVFSEVLAKEEQDNLVSVYADHVDGKMSAPFRDEKLGWLKAKPANSKECRILTNVRCLSEGVDVPTLDAVLFLSARNSEIDVVQSVGRVMRRAPGKKYGYIIIPVVVPSNVEPDKALDDNERYRVVWTVLNALRAHDDRFNAIVNKIELNKHKPSQIIVGGIDRSFGVQGDGAYTAGEPAQYNGRSLEPGNQLSMQFEKLQSVVFARMVKKVGDRRYWEEWAKDVAQIAERHIERITRLVKNDKDHGQAFEDFLGGLRKNINPSISAEVAIEMLAQHIITKPVFEALFEGYSFVKNNPISVSMQQMLDLLEEQSLDKDAENLQKFYEYVKTRAAGIDNAEGKQRIIIELYDKFFKSAFPKMVEILGIVYTPVELVDFIIFSVEVILKKEFGRSLSDENIHILDPFTGTGTFITRLLQSGLIQPKDLLRKYTHELHANEIVLLAYYIAAINIENAFHDLVGESSQYKAFDGICLTDTFQLGESDESEKLFSEMFPQNSERVEAQKKTPLRVIMCNPPYSVGQKSANDNAQNQKYDKLDERISKTYAAESKATNKNSIYNSYIKAFRWSTDRLSKEGGIIAFITDGGWLENNAMDGFRNCLEKEFSTIYIFNLRGDARTQGELRRKESGNVFGGGSRTKIAISFLVKNPGEKKVKAEVHYHDIGDYLSNEKKVNIVSKFGSIGNEEMSWQILKPNEHGDWLSQRNDIFGTFISLGEKGEKNTFFNPGLYCRGLETARDSWVYNSNKSALTENIRKSIDFFNEQSQLYAKEKSKKINLEIEDLITYDAKRISWSRAFISDAVLGKTKTFNEDRVTIGMYRPFFKQHVYFSRELNNVVSRMDSFFPLPDLENKIICVSGAGSNKDFSPLITDCIPDLHFNGDTQCFPLYYYEEQKKQTQTLFDRAKDASEFEYVRRDGVSDFILKQARAAYGERVSKEDIFYYVYGILHSPDYRHAFASDLKKMLPRIPLVDEPKDFWAFSKAGRKLAELHIGYESVPPADGVVVKGAESGFFKVEKMRFPNKEDMRRIAFNSKITIENIPDEAYLYVVNGKSAIEWVMERYQVTVNKDSGIRNDPNDWAVENERYILDLLLGVIRVGVETVGVVRGLPGMGLV